MSTQAINRVAKNTGILYLRMAITVFISLYATRLTLTALGVEDFGLYNLVGGVIAMLGFLNASMSSSTQRFMSFAQGQGDLNKIKQIFNMSTLLHLGIAVAVVIAFEIAGYFFFNGVLNIETARLPIAKLVYQFMVISTLFTIISVPYEAVITSHENMLFYAILGIIESVLKLGIAFYISYGSLSLPTDISLIDNHILIKYSLFDNLIIYGLLMALLNVLMLLVRRIYCHINYAECELSFKKHYNKSLIRQISSFAGWSLLGSASSMVSLYGQGIVINLFFGTSVNAAQGLANQISGQLGTFAITLIKALNPMIDKSEGAGNRALMLKATMMGSKVSFFLMMILHIPMLIEMPFILKLWLTNVPEFSVIFCQLLLARNLIEQLFNPLVSAISAQGNIRGYQTTSSLMTLLPLPVSYILFKLNYPAYSMYVIFILYSMLLSTIILYFAKKNCQLPINEFVGNVIIRCAAAFTFVFSLSLIPYFYIPHGFTRLIGVIVTSILCYLIIVYLVGFSNEERIKIKQLAFILISKLAIKNNKKLIIF